MTDSKTEGYAEFPRRKFEDSLSFDCLLLLFAFERAFSAVADFAAELMSAMVVVASAIVAADAASKN